MRAKKIIPAILAAALSTFGCVYIVLPEGLEDASGGAGSENAGWTAIATNVAESEPGILRIDLTIRNDTGVWSAMRAADDQPAVLEAGDGTKTDCSTVFVGTGGHRLAPGFQVRGYTRDEAGEPVTQLLFVECAATAASPASTLSVNYYYFMGDVDYYVEI